METTKVTNREIQTLSQEIQIFAAELTKTVLNEKGERVPVNPSFLPKFHLNNFSVAVTPFFKNLEETRIEMVKKLGTPSKDNPESITIEEFVKDENGEQTSEKTKEFLEFEKEFTLLLDAEVDISYNPMPLSVFEVLKIDNFYPTLFKFMK